MNVDYKVDLLVLGMGAAAELAAIYAHDANPDLNILIATKALKGKGGCSRMVQGGFNVVLDPGDSHEKHLMDTLKGGQYINDQDLALQLVEQATPTVKELETISGCFFDRRPDGHIHQKAFAGQCFDRTVHKGDLTGIEIISRTTEQVFKRRIPVLEETRAVELLLDADDRLLEGMNGSAVILSESARDVPLVPLSAVYEDADGAYVYRLDGDGQQVRTPIQTGLSDGTNAQVLSGLQEGDTIVCGGETRENPGQAMGFAGMLERREALMGGETDA